MEVIWHIVLTVCLGSTCLDQDIQWFDTEHQCRKMLERYAEIPADGDWDSVAWECKPIGAKST